MASAIVIMGVAGCGKSLVGAQLSARLGLALIEGDDFHPRANIDKMVDAGMEAVKWMRVSK